MEMEVVTCVCHLITYSGAPPLVITLNSTLSQIEHGNGGGHMGVYIM